MVVFDSKAKFTITQKKLHMNVAYTPYEGMNLTKMPMLVHSPGAKVAEWGGPHEVCRQAETWPVRETGTFSRLLDHSDRQYPPEANVCSGPWSAFLGHLPFQKSIGQQEGDQLPVGVVFVAEKSDHLFFFLPCCVGHDPG